MPAAESEPGPDPNTQLDGRYIDPIKLARSAVAELVMAANSGQFDHDKIHKLRVQVKEIETGDDEYLVMRLPKELM